MQINKSYKIETMKSSVMSARNSAIADKPCDAFRRQSRSSNMKPLHRLGMVSY